VADQIFKAVFLLAIFKSYQSTCSSPGWSVYKPIDKSNLSIFLKQLGYMTLGLAGFDILILLQ